MERESAPSLTYCIMLSPCSYTDAGLWHQETEKWCSTILPRRGENRLLRMCLWWERPGKLTYTERAWNFSSHGVRSLPTLLPLATRSFTYCTLTRDGEDVTLWIATDACIFNIQQAVVTWAGCSAYSEFSQFVHWVSEQTARQKVDEEVLGGFLR